MMLRKWKTGEMKYVRHIYWLILIRNSVGSFEMYHRRRFSHVKMYSIFSQLRFKKVAALAAIKKFRIEEEAENSSVNMRFHR